MPERVLACRSGAGAGRRRHRRRRSLAGLQEQSPLPASSTLSSMVSSTHEHHDYVRRHKFPQPVRREDVERDWRPRGYSCDLFVDPPGKARATALLDGVLPSAGSVQRKALGLASHSAVTPLRPVDRPAAPTPMRAPSPAAYSPSSLPPRSGPTLCTKRTSW